MTKETQLDVVVKDLDQTILDHKAEFGKVHRIRLESRVMSHIIKKSTSKSEAQCDGMSNYQGIPVVEVYDQNEVFLFSVE